MARRMTPACLRYTLRLIGNLSRTGMVDGNAGDFDSAFLKMEDAMSYVRILDKKCLEAKLLNNMGLLYTMSGQWDLALLNFEQALAIVADHYGTGNILYKTLQKNMGYLLDLDVAAA